MTGKGKAGLAMDLASIEQRLMSGEALKVKYRYPCDSSDREGGRAYGVRTDKLVDVSTELNRLYALFRGVTPIWLEQSDVIEILPDDGVYEEFSDES